MDNKTLENKLKEILNEVSETKPNSFGELEDKVFEAMQKFKSYLIEIMIKESNDQKHQDDSNKSEK